MTARAPEAEGEPSSDASSGADSAISPPSTRLLTIAMVPTVGAPLSGLVVVIADQGRADPELADVHDDGVHHQSHREDAEVLGDQQAGDDGGGRELAEAGDRDLGCAPGRASSHLAAERVTRVPGGFDRRVGDGHTPLRRHRRQRMRPSRSRTTRRPEPWRLRWQPLRPGGLAPGRVPARLSAGGPPDRGRGRRRRSRRPARLQCCRRRRRVRPARARWWRWLVGSGRRGAPPRRVRTRLPGPFSTASKASRRPSKSARKVENTVLCMLAWWMR